MSTRWFLAWATCRWMWPKDADRSTVLESDDANQLRIRFQDAIDNQIEYDPNEGSASGPFEIVQGLPQLPI